jgi:hypothetical protein
VRRRNKIILAAVAATMLGLVGFVAFVVYAAIDRAYGPKDVTNDPAFGDFTSVVGTWKTKVPLRLVEIEFRGDKKLYLVYGDQYISRSRELPEVPAGTEIRIERLIYRDTFETSFLDVTGSLGTGPYSGKSVMLDRSLFAADVVDRYCIWHVDPSKPKPKWTVAPEKLEPIAPASAATGPTR